MENIYDYIAAIRALVNDYESLIDKLKYYKNIARHNPEKIDTLKPIMENVVKRTESLISENIDIERENSDLSLKYVRTYRNYLILVSIPYTIDLLKEIKYELIQYNHIDHAKYIDGVLSKFVACIGSAGENSY